MKLSTCEACFKRGTHTSSLCNGCYQLKRKYAVDPVDIHKLLLAQGGTCAICHKPPYKKKLAVDHNHLTGKIRGLLCTRCNIGIGYLATPELLELAANYLRLPIPDLHYIDPSLRNVKIESSLDLLERILNDPSYPSLNARARALAAKTGLTPAAAMSRLRRTISRGVSTACRDLPDTIEATSKLTIDVTIV
jgi:hypothetical protein